MAATEFQFNEIDLKAIFKSVWGYAAPPFLYSLQNKVEKSLFGSEATNSGYSFGNLADRRVFSITGTDFYSKNNNGNEVFMPTWLRPPGGDWFLLQNTVMSLANKKTIVETPMVNRRGSVKEEVSIEDWEINVKGIIVSSDYDYPDDQVQSLVSIYEQEMALDIMNVRTDLTIKGDEKVVLKSLTFPELKGMKNIQPFELNMVSDNQFDLYLK